ncbi:hypothetical protein BKA82DRAFT_333960 [Pisolithus tinctorius]|uniref:Uncharacterized protein n=1 Tax=Pisolithus tinctorius Marx 270 TaxID=870435 RepID=A0A0C3JBI3_PISTI|nr:hypothetical protein BKA82DRAFT_333960 [Pisolithus tinctorius]KIN95041.1 hypothetical protein M404DRAFT_333960 [Pisolithus tinctorius Marx 270]
MSTTRLSSPRRWTCRGANNGGRLVAPRTSPPSQRTGILPARSQRCIARHRRHDSGEITRIVITTFYRANKLGTADSVMTFKVLCALNCFQRCPVANHALIQRTLMFASLLPLGTSHTPGTPPWHRCPIQIISALLADSLGCRKYWLTRSYLLWSSGLMSFRLSRAERFSHRATTQLTKSVD